MPSIEDAPFVNPSDPAVQADAERIYSGLRAQAPLARTPLGVTVVRREHVHRLLGDRRLVSAMLPLVRMQGLADTQAGDLFAATVITKDGADHTRLRRLVAPSFTPRAADRHRPVMRQLVEQLLDRFTSSGRCEFISDFADHYPVQVICEVLGVPRADHERFARWGDALTYVLSLELGAHLDEVVQAASELASYIDALVAERRADPQDDLVTSLVEASEAGDRLNEAELRAMIGGLLFAGYDTTRNQLGNALIAFSEHPDQWALLAENPELAANAVNEVMRLSGAVVGVPRIAAEDVDVDEWTIPAGTLVFLSMASANRDERSFNDPLRFDITADRPPHLTFGGGPHYCLGANLARAEMEEALRRLPGRMPHMRLAGEAEWRAGTGITGPSRLPLAFDPGPRGCVGRP